MPGQPNSQQPRATHQYWGAVQREALREASRAQPRPAKSSRIGNWKPLKVPPPSSITPRGRRT